MDIELVKCECCGLKEDCTQEYISEVKAKFEGKWLCGLCSEAVSDEMHRGKKQSGMDEAVKAHMSFCRKYKSKNPAVRVADGMRQMLRRRSGDMSSSPSSSAKKYSRSSSTCQGEGLQPWRLLLVFFFLLVYFLETTSKFSLVESTSIPHVFNYKFTLAQNYGA